MDNQAFLSGNDNDEENFAALDSMVPNPSYGFGQPKPSSQMNAPTSEPGFSGVSGSLFDRIRARTEEQQKQAAQSQAASVQQQNPSEPTMEFEKSPDAPQTQNSFDTAVANASSGAPQPTLNETTYSFSGPSDFSSAVPHHIPTYGPSRNNQYISVDNQQQYPTSMKDKASAALVSLWSGAQTFVASAQEKMKGGQSGGGYNTNFLLREDGLEGGVGAGPPMSGFGSQPSGNQTSEGGAASFVSGQAYSMFSYGKTFCEDMYGFFLQLPNWGKGAVVIVTLLLIKFLFFW
jgi:hypothetical protein